MPTQPNQTGVRKALLCIGAAALVGLVVSWPTSKAVEFRAEPMGIVVPLFAAYLINAVALFIAPIVAAFACKRRLRPIVLIVFLAAMFHPVFTEPDLRRWGVFAGLAVYIFVCMGLGSVFAWAFGQPRGRSASFPPPPAPDPPMKPGAGASESAPRREP